MTIEEAIDAGARAIQREDCRWTPRREITPGVDMSEEELWDRRWDDTHPNVQDRYRAEAAAVLHAVGIMP